MACASWEAPCAGEIGLHHQLCKKGLKDPPSSKGNNCRVSRQKSSGQRAEGNRVPEDRLNLTQGLLSYYDHCDVSSTGCSSRSGIAPGCCNLG